MTTIELNGITNGFIELIMVKDNKLTSQTKDEHYITANYNTENIVS